MKSDIHSIYNLLSDPSFLDWIKNPNGETNRYWEEWQGTNPERKAQVKQAKAIASSIDFKKTSIENIRQDLIFQRIQNSINEENEDSIPKGLTKNNKLKEQASIRIWMRWAAIFVGLLVVSSIYYFAFNEDIISHTTAFGETKNITLPDGSEIKLNGNSTLTHSRIWESDEIREVWLEGEGYFTVNHLGDQQKFIVHATSDFNVEVVGTEFNVLNRSGKTKVVLSSGKVMLNLQNSAKPERLQMVPGEMAEYTHNDQVLTKKEVDPMVYTSWRNNRLLFDDTSLLEIKSILESTYGLTVIVEDESLLEKRLYGSAPSNDITLLLKGLERSLGNQISIEGKLVTIK